MSKNSISTARMRGCAEAWSRRSGERHSYSELLEGLSCVLRAEGVIVNMRGWDVLHDPLASLDPAKHDVLQIAKGVDGTIRRNFTGSRAEELPYELQGRHYAQSFRGVSIGAGLASEVLAYLKENKIRKGSKQHKEFIAKNTSRVFAAAEREVKAGLTQAERTCEANAVKSRKLVAETERSIEHLKRLLELHGGLMSAAGLPSDTEASQAVERRIGLFQRAKADLTGQIKYDKQQVAALDMQTLVIEGLRAHTVLRPFLGE